MTSPVALKEKLLPKKERFSLFAELGYPHEITATIYTYPFRHIVIDNFLPAAQYEALARNFRKIYAKGFGPEWDRERFTRFDLYDLYAHVPKPSLDLPLGAFFSEPYFQMLENALRRPFSRDTFVTYHHHQPNPVDNYIHNDFVYEYFVDNPLENGVNAWYYQCDKQHPSAVSRPVVRAATSIFYLANEWKEGQGGETAIFKTKDLPSLVRRVPPVNNRLLAFDITPYSFHSYLKCFMPARNSIAQWYYCSEEEAFARFPDVKPGGWQRGAPGSKS